MVGAENINVNLKIKKDGHFLIEDFITESQESDPVDAVTGLPFGFKLSNNLPNIRVKNYNLSFIDLPTDKSYSIYGDSISITDFIFNKKIKVVADGKFMLQDRDQFSYDIKVLNKIMPDLDINDVIFASKEQEVQKEQDIAINLTDIFKAIYNNHLTAKLAANMVISGTTDDIDLQGSANVSDFSVAVDGKSLPAGNADIKLKGNKIKLYSKLYTAEKEITEIIGDFKTGKHPYIDLNCKSNARFKSLIDLADSVAKSFGNSTLDTLSATGGVDADFNIKSDLKSISSSGFFKIPNATLTYKLYNIFIDKIFADIQLANNILNIQDVKFSIFNQPLNIKGCINEDASADLKVTADKLQLKGLLLAAGQVALLRENQINSGTISINALLKGKLDKIVPKVFVDVNNVNVKNIPSNTSVSLADAKVNLTTDGKKTDGNVYINNVKIVNPMAVISAPKAEVVFGEKDIDIKSAYILLNNSRVDITGKVADYMTKNINFNINAKGNLLASDIKAMIPKELKSEVDAKGTLPLSISVTGNDKTQDINFIINSNSANYLSMLNIEQLKGKNTDIKGNIKLNGDVLKFSDAGIYANGNGVAYLKGGINDLYKSQTLNLNLSVPSNVTMSVPYVKNSKMVAGGHIDITGNAINPYLKGAVSVPKISMPDMALSMENLDVSLNGIIAKGKGTLKKFVCGGIEAENLSSDFNLTNNIFYLKNISGDAFKGKISGNISYNIINGHVGVGLKGSGMDAEKAIYGAAGLKNALSGTLNFNANVTTSGETDVKMMKNLKGKATFDIADGELGNIGRFDNLLLAQNIMANPILKAGVNAIRTLPVIKNTAQFKTINGTLSFSDGWATLVPVKTSGPSMSYYITGKYNLLNATANVVVLGRISAEVVKLLGPLGDLSVSKLTSLIPGVGSTTVALIRAITTNPYGEKISEIPQLSSGNKNYKDFKVQFNGGVESASSVKSFRWLSVCDTSEIESFKIKDQVENVKQAVQEAKQQQIDAFNKKMEEQRKQAQEANQELKNAAEGLKNLLKKQTKTEPVQETAVPEAASESVPEAVQEQVSGE